MVRTSTKSQGTLGFKIVSRPDWVRHRAVGSKFDDAIDAALKLNNEKVVRVQSAGMKFNSLSTALRIRIAQRKLNKKIHVEQNKKTKQIAIVKGLGLFKGTSRRPKAKLLPTRQPKAQS